MEIKCNFCRLGFLYPIDNLEYQYSHNKLIKVIDHTNSLDGFRDGQHPDGVTMPDYGYDLNGNMKYDWNKGIDFITYNHLNLPTRINFKVDQGEKFISYIYNALGQKVSKQVVHQSSTEQVNTLTEYLSGYQYVGGILQLFPTAEGYVSVTNGKDFDYVYNYTDHIGNVRLSYTMPKGSTVLSILEENHYYPFGMKHANYGDDKHDYVRNPDGTGYAVIDQVHRNKYQYKYNGKEFQDELSLNWYDYHARNYDPAIGRWMNIDPLAEVSRRWSPYNYCMNNPVYFIDPDGMKVSYGEFIDNAGHESVSEQQDKAAAASLETTVANASKAGGDSGSDGEPKGKNKNKSKEKKTINNKGEILVGNIKPEEVDILNTISNEFTPENNTIIWVSHGSSNGINGGMMASEFHNYLMATSPLYKSSYENGKSVTIKLFSCNTGHNIPDGLAYNLSLIHTKANIWAPDNLISWPPDNGILFPNYEPYIGLDGQKFGQFNIFNNGNVVGTGDFKN